MVSLADLESQVWDEIRKATGCMDAHKIAHFSAIARDIGEKKREWEARMTAGSLDPHGPASSPVQVPTPTNGLKRRGHRRPSADYTGRPIRGFEFEGNHVPVNTYKGLLIELANILRRRHPQDFDTKVLSFGGRKRRYFSRDAGDLKYAQELEGHNLYVETNLNANLAVGICFDMVRELGHSEADLTLQ